MESLEIKLTPEMIAAVGKVNALRDTCMMAVAAEKIGIKLDRTNAHEGIPTNIVITDTTGKKTKEDLLCYTRTCLPWYKI